MELRGDPRLAGASEDIRRLRRIAGEMSAYRPASPALAELSVATYVSRLDFLGEQRVAALPVPKETFLFDGMLVTLDGDDAGEPAPSTLAPAPGDVELILRPSPLSVLEHISAALDDPRPYPVDSPVRPIPLRAPDYGRIPTDFHAPPPDYPIPEGRGAMKALDGLVRWSNKDKLRDYEESLQVWEEARREFLEALRDVQAASAEMQQRVEATNARLQAEFDVLASAHEAARLEWEAAAGEETAYLQDLLEQLQLAYLDDPVELARLALALTPLPNWLPERVDGSFDPSGVLTIDHDFPDERALDWGDAAAGADPLALRDHFYAVLALRCAHEIARTANQNTVAEIIFNGWVTRIDPVSGRLGRVCVATLAADGADLLAVDFGADLDEAFVGRRGRAARAHGVEHVRAHSAEELRQIHLDEQAEALERERAADAERIRLREAAEADLQRQRKAADVEARRQRKAAAEAEAKRFREEAEALIEAEADALDEADDAAEPEPEPEIVTEAPPPPRGRKSASAPPPAAEPEGAVALIDEARFDQMCRDLVAKEFSSNGEDVTISSSPGDHGFLAVIIDRHPLKGGKLVVQTRWSAEATRVSAVRELYGAIVSEGAAKGIHISAGTYAKEANDFASGKPITLVGGSELLGLLATDAATGKASPQLRLVFNSDPPSSRTG